MSLTDKTLEDINDELHKLQESYNILKGQYHLALAHLKEVEEKANKSEEIFRNAFMTSSDSVNINRLTDGMYVSINEGFTKILGYTEADVIGKSSLDLNIWVDPDDRKELSSRLRQSGRVDNLEALFRKKDGTIITGSMSASLIDLNGITHILNITKDITVIKDIEEAFTQEQLFMDALMNNLTDYIYIKDLENRFIRINKSHALVLGLKDTDDVIGKSDRDFYSREHVQQAYEDEQNILRTGKTINKEEKLTHLNGPDSWVSTVKMPFRNKAGNIIGTFGISRDITDRKRIELENQIIYEIAHGVTTTSNLDELLKLIHSSLGKVVYAENCFIALYDDITNQFSFPYFVDKFDSAPMPTSMAKSCTAFVLRTGKPLLYTSELFDKLEKQGEIELVGSASPSWIGIPLQTPSKVIGVLVIQHYEKENVYSDNDVKFLISIGSQLAISIERKKSEEEIRLKNELLLAINAEKDKFFSILAHDLRGPLSSFVAATQILTEEIQTMNLDEIKDITLSMKTSASNIYSLLENLLEWSRLKRGGMDFIPETLNLRKKINDCLVLMSESARDKNIAITSSIPGDLEVFADDHMFDTIIRNMLSNALKFTPVGGKVGVTAQRKNGKFIEIRITDSGIGMTNELKSKLFMLNEKTRRNGTEGELSTGLGLLLCKEFIDRHSGIIFVESEPGKGSTFSITIPVLSNR